MKVMAQPLREHLDSGVTTMCTCWRVTRTDGLVQGFTEHDEDLRFDGTTFLAASGFSASQVQQSLGLAADNLSVTGALSSAAISEDDLVAGRYDDAYLELFWVNWRDPEKRLLQMAGYTGEAKRTGLAFTAELRGLASRLSQAIPAPSSAPATRGSATAAARSGSPRAGTRAAARSRRCSDRAPAGERPRQLCQRLVQPGGVQLRLLERGAVRDLQPGADRQCLSRRGRARGLLLAGLGHLREPVPDDHASVRAASVLEEPAGALRLLRRAGARNGRGRVGADVRRPPPDRGRSRPSIWVPHWLFAARSSIRLRRMVLDKEVAFAAHGGGQIRGVLDDDATVTVYQVYDAAGTLLWANPWSNVLERHAAHDRLGRVARRRRRLGDRDRGRRGRRPTRSLTPRATAR